MAFSQYLNFNLLKILYNFTSNIEKATLEYSINVASEKFDKKNKHSPLKYANLCSRISNKTEVSEKNPKIDKRRSILLEYSGL